MKASLDDGLKVLLSSVEHHSNSGKEYPVFTKYLKDGINDLSAEDVEKFHKELQAVSGTLGELEVGLLEDGNFVPVEALGEYSAKEAIKMFLDFHAERSGDAIVFDSGFGKYANFPFCKVRFMKGKGVENSKVMGL